MWIANLVTKTICQFWFDDVCVCVCVGSGEGLFMTYFYQYWNRTLTL